MKVCGPAKNRQWNSIEGVKGMQSPGVIFSHSPVTM